MAKVIEWFDLLLSVGVIVALPLIYWFVIRPRLVMSPGMAEIYSRIDSVEASTWAWIKTSIWRFRTFLIGMGGIVVGVLPDVLEQLHLVQWDDILPDEWKSWVPMVTIVLMVLARAVATTPGNQPPES